MSIVKSKEFWIGAAVAIALVKFGGSLPVVGPQLAKLK